MTITTSKATVAALSQSLTARGLFSKTIELEGVYHTLALSEALERLLALSASDKSLQFGNAPLVPLRSNVDGQIIGQSSLEHTALEILLTKVSRWDTTLLNALTHMTDHGNKTVLTLGPMDSVPALTLRELGADITIASGSKTFVTGCLQSNLTTPGLDTLGVVEAPEYRYPVDAVAIVGMSCRFPGADSVEEFWELLSAGTSMVRNIPSERFPTKGLRRTPKMGPENFWGNFLSDPDTFDHKFFKKSSREAQQMDPQQRLLLEVAYEALLSSGYFGEVPNDSQADTGVYLGIGATDYSDNVGSHPPNAFSAVGTLRAFLSGKLSHYFGWTGPSITYDTACSSSAVALHSACRAIASGECSRALAGGANVITSPNLHQNLAAASFLSPTGATKAFDAKADGYCRGEGVGLVVLKRLSDAIAEGDNVLGVIAGSAVNQNSNESAITVPHSPSQVKLYRKAAALAGIKTRDVSFVVGHLHLSHTYILTYINIHRRRMERGRLLVIPLSMRASRTLSVDHREIARCIWAQSKPMWAIARQLPASLRLSRLSLCYNAVRYRCRPISPDSIQKSSPASQTLLKFHARHNPGKPISVLLVSTTMAPLEAMVPSSFARLPQFQNPAQPQWLLATRSSFQLTPSQVFRITVDF